MLRGDSIARPSPFTSGLAWTRYSAEQKQALLRDIPAMLKFVKAL